MDALPQTAVDEVTKWQGRVCPLRPVSDVNWLVAGGVASWMAAKTGTVAWYDEGRDAVVVPRQYVSVVGEKLYAPTVTHELTHAFQRLRWGLLCYKWSKTFRRRLLEAEAVREEKRAEKVLGVNVLGEEP